jgi:hypothetical protein
MATSSTIGALWSALDALAAASPPPAADAFALVLGSAGGGKSGLVAALGAGAGAGAAPTRERERDASSASSASSASAASDAATTPTIALEYTALRNAGFATAAAAAPAAAAAAAAASSPAPPLPRELAHVWELGGSSLALANLVEMPLTATRLPSAVVVLALDLSRPGDLCATAARWLAVVRRRADEVLKKKRPAGAGAGSGVGTGAGADAAGGSTDLAALSVTRARLRVGYAQRGGQRVATAPAAAAAAAGSTAPGLSGSAAMLVPAGDGGGGIAGAPAPFSAEFVLSPASALAEHPDWASLLLPAGALLPMQSIVVGTKWDRLCDEDAPKRRAALAALRFVGLCAGAHVCCTSQRDRGTLSAFRALFLHAAFGAELRRGAAADEAAAQPLCIPAGADSLDAILAALGAGGGVVSSPGANLKGIGAASAQQARLALSRAEVETAAAGAGSGSNSGGGAGALLPGFAARLDKVASRIRLFYRASDPTAADAEDAAAAAAAAEGAPGGEDNAAAAAAVAFADEAATQYPEPRIDEIRLRKAQALAAYLAEAREKERRAALEAKALAKGAATPATASVGTAPRKTAAAAPVGAAAEGKHTG